MEENNIKSLFVFEMLGRPPEHIKKTLEDFVNKLGEQKGVEIIRKEVHEPKPCEKQGMENLFTTFAEVELIVDNLNLIFDITLNMLPSHVEIIEPKELRLKNFDLSSIVSNLTIKIHRYDELAKSSILERNALIQRLREAQEKIDNLEKGIKKETPKKKAEKKPKKKNVKKKRK